MKKDWIERELTMEVVVGAFMLIVLFGLCYFTFVLSGKNWGKEKYQMEVVFNNVMGLRMKDTVVARGMPVGEVTELKLDDNGTGVLVTLELKSKLNMREDYKISIVSTSILGGRQLQIYEGPESNKELKNVKRYVGGKPYDLMADAAELIAGIKDEFVGEGGVLHNFREVSEQLKDISTRLNEGKGTLGKLLSDDETLYNEIEETISEVRATIDDVRETAPIVTFSSVFFGAF